MDNIFVFKSIRELSKLIRTKQVSPVDLTKSCLARLENIGTKYNAVVTVTHERAIAQAQRAEKEILAGNYKGPLHGVPYGAKDLLATSGGIPTTWGAEPFRNQTFDFDATVIRKLENAGAVLVAKLAMVELAGCMDYRQPDASFTGPGRNPWNPETWSGGSSSGSAISVAAGVVPFTIGSETWGSILLPSNNCGVSGLRPTYGRVSRYGAMSLSWTLDKLGPLCLTADDCGLVLNAISGADPKDPTTSELEYQYDDSVIAGQRFKLAMPKGATDGVDEATKVNFEQAIRALKRIANIEEIELPDLPYEAIVRIISKVESASAFEEFIENGKASKLTAPEDRFGPYARTAILAQDYLKALRVRGKMAVVVDNLLTSFDAILSPTYFSVATPIDQDFDAAFRGNVRDIMGAMGNGAGLPAISVPNGFSANGLPTGIQFMGQAYDENRILATARAYQSISEWHKYHPMDLVP